MLLSRALLFLTAAAAFGVGPLAGRLGPVVGSAALVLLGVALALTASGTTSALAAAAGALGAFASGVLVTVSPAVAGAALVALCYAERTVRVRAPAARAVHVGIALVTGALAGAVTDHYLAADLTVRIVVVVVAAVLVALPLLVEADDPLAHALGEIADEVDEPARSSLIEGAELCRTVDASMLDRPTALQARRTWRALLRLAQARSRLAHAHRVALPVAAAPVPAAASAEDEAGSESEDRPKPSANHGDAVLKRLDQKIADHVAALARMYTAADSAKAAEASLDDEAMRSVQTSGETLEEMSKAIVEEV